MKLEARILDVCPPDYFIGSDIAHVCVNVWRGMTTGQLKEAIRHEIKNGFVAGDNRLAHLLSCDIVLAEDEKEADEATAAAYAAISKLRGTGNGRLFQRLEKDNNDCYAYVAFIEV